MKTTASTSLHRLAAGLLLIAAALLPQRSAAQEVYMLDDNHTAVSLRTNALYWLALSPNIGVELQTDIGLALQLDYVGAWWNSDARQHYFSNYGFQTEVRYYLDSARQHFPYARHHVGLYLQLATYDFEFGGTGYQSAELDKTWGLGAAYGFTIPIGNRWSLDLTAGIGFFRSKYDIYDPYEGQYIRTNSKCLRYFGPTRLEASFVYHLNYRNKGYSK
jgi:hypothetical protein